MPEEFDVNKIVVEFMNQNIESFFKVGKAAFKDGADIIRLNLKQSYSDYLTCVVERYSKAKSFFIRNEPTFLYSFYVPIGVSCGEIIEEQAYSHKLSSINPFIVITGNGSSGKSMLMRHLLLDTIKQRDKVPIFLELRELNRTNRSIMEFIRDTLHLNHFELDDDYILKAMKAGHFAFLFDGFDELTVELRKDVSKQLLHLSKRFDGNHIYVSSRPDDEFSRWTAFNIFETNSLTLLQACDLVTKLPFDDELKTKFLDDLNQSLYMKHGSFLSNPLLLSIMLLTYGQSADIPNKLNIFYNQAYEALFQRHDALKGAYQRERFCKLDIQDFAKVFSAFAIQTYDKRMFQFSRSEALDILETSKKIVGIEFSSEDYLKDSLQAVCLLVEDGLSITFSHRSFQEYFVARFIQHSKREVQQKLINKYSEVLDVDSVMHLLYEMNPTLIEQLYIIPQLTRLEETIKLTKKVGISHYLRYLKASVTDIHINDNRISGFFLKNGSFHALVGFTLQHCGHLVGWSSDKSRYSNGNQEKKWKNYADAQGEAIIKVSKLTYRDAFIKDLASETYFHPFSMGGLRQSLSIKEALVRRHKVIDNSIDKILGI